MFVCYNNNHRTNVYGLFAREDLKMTFAEVIRTVLEFAAVVLLIIGFFNEKKVVAFEVKLSRAIKIHLRNRRIRKQREKVAMAARVQSRAVEDFFDEEPVLTLVNGGASVHQVA